MRQVLNLYRLQQIDSQADQVRSRLDIIRQALENNAELKSQQAEYDSASEAVKLAEKELQQRERLVQDQHIKIEQAESSLYSGRVHNPKELQDLENDVAALKRRLAILEDEQLEAMLTFESAQSKQQDASTALETIRSRVLVQNEHLAEERATLKKESDRFATERQAVVVCIDVGDLALYDQLRQQKRGVAVATVLDDACSACGAPLTASQQQAARAVNQSQLARCPTCSRILYVD